MIGCSFSLPIRSRLSELSSQSWHLNTQIIPDFMSVISTLSKYQRKFFFPPSCYRKVNQHLIKIIIESRRQSKFLILKKKLNWHPNLPSKHPQRILIILCQDKYMHWNISEKPLAVRLLMLIIIHHICHGSQKLLQL